MLVNYPHFKVQVNVECGATVVQEGPIVSELILTFNVQVNVECGTMVVQEGLIPCRSFISMEEK
jgi:hypothetical protein